MILLFAAIVAIIALLSIYFFLGDRDFDPPGWAFEPRAYYGTAGIKGVNLGNAYEAPTPGEWGVVLKPDYLTAIFQAGFNTVRFPVRVSAHTQPNPPYTIDPGLFSRMDDIIASGLANGLTVILDVHHYQEIMTNPPGQETRFLAIWEQLGEHYQDYPDNLYFELLNEPTGRLDYATWNDLLAKGVKVVRKTNPDRKILIDTAHDAHADGLKELVLPVDQNLIATFHYYEPFPFTHQGADWVDGADRWQGTIWTGNSAEQKRIDSVMDMAAEWSKNNKTPVVIGEFGAINKADRDSRARWMDAVSRQAEEHNIGWIHWQLCSDFPLYDCQNNMWDETMLRALISNK